MANVKRFSVLGFILINVGFLSIACLDNQNKKSYHQEPEVTTSQELIETLIYSIPVLKNHEFVSLMVLNGNLCSSCTNEIIEYNNAINEYVNSPLNDRKIHQHLLVLGNNKSDKERIINQLNLSLNSDFININSNFAKRYSDSKSENMSDNQIILLNIKNKKILSRIGIYTTSTKMYFKKNLIQEKFAL